MGFIADLFVRVGADTTGLKKGLKEGKAEVTGFGAQLNKTVKSLTGFDLKTISVGAAVWKLAQFMSESIKVASDLAETTSKVGVVFGDQANVVMAFGETTAKALGMSENAALSAAGTYGNLFRAMGITEETSATMSIELVKLASDLASFNNMDPTLVLDKLRAGLSGEVEPLRSVGVNLNEVTIKQKAMELGLYSGTGAITAAAKAQASYALILEQTTLAQGDFARTADGLANSQRILAAQWEDLKADAGEIALPVAADFTNLLVNAMDGYKRLAYAINVVNEAKEKGIITDTGQANALFKTAMATYVVIEATERAKEAPEVYRDMAEALRGVNDESNNLFGTQDLLAGNIGDTTSSILDETFALADLTAQQIFNAASANMDADAALDLAVAMGLVSEDAITARKVLAELDQMQNSGRLSAKDYADAVLNLSRQIDSLKSKSIDVVVNIITNGKMPSMGGQGGVTVMGGTVAGGGGGGSNQGPSVFWGGGKASGASYVVPPGFNDTWPVSPGVYAKSGERVDIEPRGRPDDSSAELVAVLRNMPNMIAVAVRDQLSRLM